MSRDSSCASAVSKCSRVTRFAGGLRARLARDLDHRHCERFVSAGRWKNMPRVRRGWGAESRRMSKSELFTHFAERFGIKRAEAGEFFDALQQLTEQELLRCGEFVAETP